MIEQNNINTFEAYQTLLGKHTAAKANMNRNAPNSIDTEPNYEIARELARMVLPVNIYTHWIWKIDVNNLMKLLKLRQDTHAQYEIRVYADAMAECLRLWMPNVYEAYVDYIRDAVHLSKQQFALIKEHITIVDASEPYSFVKDTEKPEKMSKREFDDLINLFK